MSMPQTYCRRASIGFGRSITVFCTVPLMMLFGGKNERNLTQNSGSAVRNARKQRKLTQRETAESMGTKQSTVSEFENHPEGTRLGTLFKMLAALDLKLQIVSRRG